MVEQRKNTADLRSDDHKKVATKLVGFSFTLLFIVFTGAEVYRAPEMLAAIRIPNPNVALLMLIIMVAIFCYRVYSFMQKEKPSKWIQSRDALKEKHQEQLIRSLREDFIKKAVDKVERYRSMGTYGGLTPVHLEDKDVTQSPHFPADAFTAKEVTFEIKIHNFTDEQVRLFKDAGLSNKRGGFGEDCPLESEGKAIDEKVSAEVKGRWRSVEHIEAYFPLLVGPLSVLSGIVFLMCRTLF